MNHSSRSRLFRICHNMCTPVAGIFLTLSIVLVPDANAQAPQSMSYQSVLRNSSNALLHNTLVGIKISVLQGSISGSEVYAETQVATTNVNGLLSIQIGNGTAINGTFAGINWGNGPHFIKTEADPTGGTNYTIIGTQEILSVPYALYANNGITTAQANAIVTMQAQIDYLLTISSYPVGSVFCSSGATQIVDVISTTGKTWMDRNLGATQVATSITDAAAYGDLYQWGRASDEHQCRNSGSTGTLSSTDQPGHGDFIIPPIGLNWRDPTNGNLWQGVNGVNNPCPSSYRLPTGAELDAERMSWISNDGPGAFASPLKLTFGGLRDFGGGSIYSVGDEGYYWSSTHDGGVRASALYFSNSYSGFGNDTRAMGYSVRCIKD
jgi:uncharacterized protein (TIGR02145 family)